MAGFPRRLASVLGSGPVSMVRRWRRRHLLAHAWWNDLYRRYGPYRASQGYDRSEEQNVEYFRFRSEWHRRIVERVRTPGGVTFLDAGCGNGLLTMLVVAMGFQVTAFDFSAEALDQARDLPGAEQVTWRRASVQRFRSRQRFDVVRCAEALVAITDDRRHARALRVLGRHLARSGRLIIEEHLVPASDVPARPPKGERIRLRSLEMYASGASRAGLRLVEHVHVDGEAHLHDLDFLIFGPIDDRAASGLQATS